jgi:hypothetical protein
VRIVEQGFKIEDICETIPAIEVLGKQVTIKHRLALGQIEEIHISVQDLYLLATATEMAVERINADQR